MDNRYILIADDVEINRELLVQMFKDKYGILEAENGKETIKLIERYKEQIEVVLLDLYMPEIDGFAVLDYMVEKKYMDLIPVIMITGDYSIETEEAGYNYGVADVIHKPFAYSIVMRRTQNIIELYDNKKNMAKRIEEQSKKIIEANQDLKETNEFLIDALSSLVEFRSLESGEHIKRIKYLTKILLKYLVKNHPEYKLTSDDVDLITKASAMHDIGKIGINEDIICKPGKLTKEEFDIMKTHTTIGCDIIAKFKRMKDKEFYKYCYEICRYHHERWDGKGYPDNLIGDEIPISAQIVAIADVYDALVNKRVYKPAYAHELAIKMIEGGECGVFSPVALECFKLAKKDFYNISLLMNSNEKK